MKVSNEDVLEYMEEKGTLLNNTLLRKANQGGLILRRNCIFFGTIKDQMTEVTGV